jgi:hypothetical protein
MWLEGKAGKVIIEYIKINAEYVFIHTKFKTLRLYFRRASASFLKTNSIIALPMF